MRGFLVCLVMGLVVAAMCLLTLHALIPGATLFRMAAMR